MSQNTYITLYSNLFVSIYHYFNNFLNVTFKFLIVALFQDPMEEYATCTSFSMQQRRYHIAVILAVFYI